MTSRSDPRVAPLGAINRGLLSNSKIAERNANTLKAQNTVAAETARPLLLHAESNVLEYLCLRDSRYIQRKLVITDVVHQLRTDR